MHNMNILDQVRDAVRARHHSLRTEDIICFWVRRFLVFHGGRNPQHLDHSHRDRFLQYLQQKEQISPEQYAQARQAITFLFSQVLGTPAATAAEPRAQNLFPSGHPAVLSPRQITCLFDQLQGSDWLLAGLLYGCGLRLTECVNLRIKDVDLNRGSLAIENSFLTKDRHLSLDTQLIPHLRIYMAHRRNQHLRDLNYGGGLVPLPVDHAHQRLTIQRHWHWQFLFPAPEESLDAKSGHRYRDHISEQAVEHSLDQAARQAGIPIPVSGQILRHSFASHLVAAGYDLALIQAELGHRVKDDAADKVASPFSGAVNAKTLSFQRGSEPDQIQETRAVYRIAS